MQNLFLEGTFADARARVRKHFRALTMSFSRVFLLLLTSLLYHMSSSIAQSPTPSTHPSCTKSSDCPSSRPVCNTSGKCDSCHIPWNAPCSLSTSLDSARACLRARSGAAQRSHSDGSCSLARFAEAAATSTDTALIDNCECECANKDRNGKLIKGRNVKQCVYRAYYNRADEERCPTDVLFEKCEIEAVCSPELYERVELTHATLPNCPTMAGAALGSR